jgi:DNA-binding CsgD family transcriptional regulator
MNKVLEPVRRTRPIAFSDRLSRSFLCIAHSSFVELDVRSESLVLTSRDLSGDPLPISPILPEAMRAPGDLVLCEELHGAADSGLARATLAGMTPHKADFGSWHSFRITFSSGVEDHIWLQMPEPGQAAMACGLLARIWPNLREDCLQDLRHRQDDVCDEAMLWMVSNQINMAILVMNRDGLMLRANAAAKRLLDQETVLRRTPKGIRCANDGQTRLLRSALSSCARSGPQDGDQILFLNAVGLGLRIPVSLSRFHHDGIATDLVLVTMPLPPDSLRVEMLARAGGLTPAEARIAALLQMGLSNKDAAVAAGLKEQSVSTYAKRVLNKLNVTSRAEMAQLLTWQAAGGGLK